MFTKVLIANRGAVACRIERTLKHLNIASVAVYSEADTGSLHVDLADEAVAIGASSSATHSYLAIERILAAATTTGAQAVHPGYGFLSENADFAEACAGVGLVFIGPKPNHIRRFGVKHAAVEFAKSLGVPTLTGTALLAHLDDALREATRIGYPVMLKSTAGGGGIGMQLVHDEAELPAAFDTVHRISKSNFGHSGMYLEKYVQRARHIEVQIFGDGLGNVVALGERECSIQRRNQKVIEETPAPGLPDNVRSRMFECAERLGRAAGYESAGTVEFIYDDETHEFYFLEVNCRLQVEHGVTEEVTGIDLVEWMIKQAADQLDLTGWTRATLPPPSSGPSSIQVRVYSEDPGKNFQPSTGTLTEVRFPRDTRVETWVERGTEVSPYYDPLLAKIIVKGRNRAEALLLLEKALAETRISGLETNLVYLRQIVASEGFRQGRVSTKYLEDLPYIASTINVIDGGTQTTVQDYPGRIGNWDVGVPPSGPMDALAFRLANRLVGNRQSAPALESTLTGPTLRFNTDAVVALTGAATDATLDEKPVSFWRSFTVKSGSTLRVNEVLEAGMRTYIAVRGGFDVPEYLGSKSTFVLGKFGGHAGRALRGGDVLHVGNDQDNNNTKDDSTIQELPPSLVPKYTREWDIAVLYGPQGAPDFFQPEDIEDLYSSTYQVHFHSARTGIRLIGPKPRWTRTDGGEAGLHPSNIHDNAYAVGTINFTGDMPIILGPDGPSLGGFVCPATIIAAELWKVGQLKPGNKVRFHVVGAAEALARELSQEHEIETFQTSPPKETIPTRRSCWEALDPAILHRIPETPNSPEVCYRRCGDKYLLVEYGPLVLDFALRFRVHALMTTIKGRCVPGLLDLTTAIRSLQFHYNSNVISLEKLMGTLLDAESHLPAVEDMEVQTRIIYMPISWEDESTLKAIRKYMQIVRKEAPWCPRNVEFIRRINGLDSVDDVKNIVLNASYLVLGLGDVYLGAPAATPIDPRHRLVTTKYNPSRTFTPISAVGIGGAYLCIYGTDGPGGYQLVGRTVPIWNRWRQTKDFTESKPWLLRFFDQIRFYEVSTEELQKLQVDFTRGHFTLRTEEETFRLGDYQKFIFDNAESIAEFKSRQQRAFDEERHRWKVSGQLNFSAENDVVSTCSANDSDIPGGHQAVTAQVQGNVWRIQVQPGERVHQNQTLVILESMKMEITVPATNAGIVTEVRCTEGKPVNTGDVIVVMKRE